MSAWIESHPSAVRKALSRHVVGSGVELGAGSQPFPAHHPGTTVRYLDRWQSDENQSLFDEVDDAPFTAPDVVCDLNTAHLGMLRDDSQDFVIASHVLEHVADPLGLFHDMHRVLRPGGLAVVILPDMRRTFDRFRPPTSLEHVVAEYEAGITEVDDDHVDEFLRHTDPDYQAQVVECDPVERQALFDLHRRRSIHVHCWDEHSFVPVIEYAIGTLGHRWEFVDGIATDDEGPDGLEFGYLLRWSTVALSTPVLVERFRSAHAEWDDLRRRLHATRTALIDAHRELAALEPVRAPVLAARRRLGAVRRRLDPSRRDVPTQPNRSSSSHL